MSEAVETTNTPPRFSWSRALTAGLVATVIMTVVLMLTGMNIMKMLGSMIAPGAGLAAQYVIGGAMHLMIGLFYGVIFAWLVSPVTEWNRFVKGTVYGLAITAIALVTMPVMSALMGGGGGAANPCGAASNGAAVANPCASKATNPGAPSAQNPCAAKDPHDAANPCAAKSADAAKNPCNAENAGAANPCAAKNPCAGENPGAAENPCAAKSGGAANACHLAAGSNPCGGGAGNPCGGSSGPYSGLISVLNHLVYGLTLAFVYGRGR